MVTEAGSAPRVAATIVSDAVARGQGALDEWQAKALLASYGVPIPDGGVARSEDEALAIAERLDGPVVIKAIGVDIAHKTEHGLVVLNLVGEAAVRGAAAP